MADGVGDAMEGMVAVGATVVVWVGMGVIDGDDDWLQDENAIKHNRRKKERNVVRFFIIDLSPLIQLHARNSFM